MTRRHSRLLLLVLKRSCSAPATAEEESSTATIWELWKLQLMQKKEREMVIMDMEVFGERSSTTNHQRSFRQLTWPSILPALAFVAFTVALAAVRDSVGGEHAYSFWLVASCLSVVVHTAIEVCLITT
ncbi:expressed unknown protein [Seminavis robusta]|uniref:Uncharacterized protein n=1 Tax=Seminavis robusta TaxID=568900 RepID=A0A9N8DPG6_9STRA|nr:expressed unknown protein [Seminavis robusta]|eukprot:Sro198_g084011.1  (128) ;mRNA; r:24791-25174